MNDLIREAISVLEICSETASAFAPLLREETARERVSEMAKAGYTSGELHDNIHATDDDPEDGVEYTGWWELKEECL